MSGSSVLYLAPVERTFDELHTSAEPVSWLEARQVGDERHWVSSGTDVRFELVGDPAAAAARLRERHYPLCVVDCRQLPDVDEADAARQERSLHSFLEAVRLERDAQRRYPFERIVVLVGGGDHDRTDRLIFDAGNHHVGLVLRDRALAPSLEAAAVVRARNRLLHELWDLAQTVIDGRKLRRAALCAAGGGITGIYYELGVLKCLEDAFSNFTMADFDMYFGISAGAVISSLLVNEIGMDELIERFGGHRGNELDVEIKLRHLNWRETPMRVRSAASHVASYLRRVRKGKERFSFTNLGWQMMSLLGPVFATDAHERRFAEFLSQPGRTNRFERLKRKLFIGATDQDARQHVLFGDERNDHPNISKAVQASSAIHPFFRSVQIGGRHYTDGFVTRTSNLVAAIERGANLIFVIDPFLPLVSGPGFQSQHGLFWNVLQDYKTVAYTRFERVTAAVLRANPQVACFTFVPSRRMRRLMSSNPMARSHFDAIVIEAYRSTYRRLRGLEHKVGPRLREYGIELDLARVVRTMTRLDLAKRPTALDLIEPGAPVVSIGGVTRDGHRPVAASDPDPVAEAG